MKKGSQKLFSDFTRMVFEWRFFGDNVSFSESADLDLFHITVRFIK